MVRGQLRRACTVLAPKIWPRNVTHHNESSRHVSEAVQVGDPLAWAATASLGDEGVAVDGRVLGSQVHEPSRVALLDDPLEQARTHGAGHVHQACQCKYACV